MKRQSLQPDQVTRIRSLVFALRDATATNVIALRSACVELLAERDDLLAERRELQQELKIKSENNRRLLVSSERAIAQNHELLNAIEGARRAGRRVEA